MQKLTRREKEIFTLLLDGLVPKEIAGKLKISYETVISHQNRMYRKLGVHSIDELFEKYQDKRDEILSAANGVKQESLFKRFNNPIILIPTGVGIAAVILFLLSNLKLTPNQNETRDNAANNTASRPALDDGIYFTETVYDEVHLRAARWGGDDAYGEQYGSNLSIRFGNKYKEDLKNLMEKSGRIGFQLRLSGSIDKECNVRFSFTHVINNETPWIDIAHSNRKSIGPGDFSEVFLVRYINTDIDTLPEQGFFIINFKNELFTITDTYFYDSGDRIPDDMPEDAIWATIRNLKFELVD